MHTVTDFAALMIKYQVPVNNEITIGGTDYLDQQEVDQLFTSVDKFRRVFINLPITVVASSAHRMAEMYNRRPSRAFTVFQRYTNRDNFFVTVAEPTPMGAHDFLGENHNNLSELEKLLSGETLRFHDIMYTDDCKAINDPDRYIDITLKC